MSWTDDDVRQAYAMGVGDAEAQFAEEQAVLATYDATVADICSRDPTIRPERLHAHVAAAGGNWDVAVQLERESRAQILAEYGVGQQTAAPAGYQRDPNLTPQQQLHRSIEQATALSKGRR